MLGRLNSVNMIPASTELLPLKKYTKAPLTLCVWIKGDLRFLLTSTTENFKQSIDGYHDSTMDLNTTTINHSHSTGWAHGSQHDQSSMPIICSPDFQDCKTCPSDCMIGGGLYEQYSMADSFTSMEQQEHNIVSANNINYNGVMKSLKSCLQPEDPTANHCSQTWVSSSHWFDCQHW